MVDFCIGLFCDGDWLFIDDFFEWIWVELVIFMDMEFLVEFVCFFNVDWSFIELYEGFDEFFDDFEIDFVLVFGFLGLQFVIFWMMGYEKLVVVVFMVDVNFQVLFWEGFSSGVFNLVYVVIDDGFERDFEVFCDIVFFEWLVFIMNCQFIVMVEFVVQVSQSQIGVDMRFFVVGCIVDSVFDQFFDDIDVVYFWFLVFDDGEFEKLFFVFNECKFFIFSGVGQEQMEVGVLVIFVLNELLQWLVWCIVFIVYCILLGEEFGEILVVFIQLECLIINVEMMCVIGVFLCWEFFFEVEFFYLDDLVVVCFDFIGVVQ